MMNQCANVNVYLFLLKGDQVLLSLRHNTGYEDGNWSLVSGHVEVNESATASLIREAREEIGIEIQEEDLKVVHVGHRKTTRENVDIFMLCKTWNHDIMNKEPEKCGGVRFFELSALPENTIDYIAQVIEHIRNNVFYSEEGWTVC